MFTGIIQAVGEVGAIESRGGDVRISIRAGKLPLEQVAIGDSIAVNGVCLTVVSLQGDSFAADVSLETLERSTFASFAPGSCVNLEPALTPSSRLGGHLVSGHVDGVGSVVEIAAAGRSQRMSFEVPTGLARYIAEKGSVCVDGASLTVNTVAGARFSINVVPHTLEETILGGYRAGTRVNVEVDLIARYLERLLLGDRAADAGTPITAAFLAEHGFLKK